MIHVPDEVFEAVKSHFRPWPEVKGWAPDPRYIRWWPKAIIDRGEAWLEVRDYGTLLGVVNEDEYTGWRKCHTKNFWVWYAVDLVEGVMRTNGGDIVALILKAVSAATSHISLAGGPLKKSRPVSVEEILGSDRPKVIVTPRQVAMYQIRCKTTASFLEIAKIFGKDHSTVQHACRKILQATKRAELLAGEADEDDSYIASLIAKTDKLMEGS
jgi:DNA-binding CsgD family transcriptional regulator